MSDSPHYSPGSSRVERLQLQARCLEGLTRRLIRESGIRAGMRVLDLGSRPGDVAFLVTEAVGPSGSVVGVDREERSIDLARRRAAEADTATLRSRSPATGPPADAPFDAAIGRLVLIHQRDPATMSAGRRPSSGREASSPFSSRRFTSMVIPCRRSSSCARRPEASALHARGAAEPRRRRPDDPLLHGGGAARTESLMGVGRAGLERRRLAALFVLTYKTFLPLMQKFGTVDPRVGDPETLAERITAEAFAKRAQGVTGPFASAWAIKG